MTSQTLLWILKIFNFCLLFVVFIMVEKLIRITEDRYERILWIVVQAIVIGLFVGKLITTFYQQGV